jgi:hypothetical protein
MDINKLVENYFKPKSTISDLNTFFKLVEEMLPSGGDPTLNEKKSKSKKISISWDGIPSLPLSELGWGTIHEGDDQALGDASEARAQIERFLNNIAGGQDMRSKIEALNAFFEKSEVTGAVTQDLKLAGIDVDNPATAIPTILSYLTFFKTFTSILTNFNASAAGFTFESFVAVLLGGQQIPTGNQTIADLTRGDDYPISLKLLTERGASVDGSYRDLIGDLAGVGKPPAPEMKYIVALKVLEEKGVTASGIVKFYEFVFSLESFLPLMTKSPTAKTVLQLPLAMVVPQEEEAGGEEQGEEEGTAWASAEESIAFLQALIDTNAWDDYREALVFTRGYVEKGRWALARTKFEKGAAEAGQPNAYIGRLYIGRKYVEEMVEQVREYINESVFEIFAQLKDLTNALQEYFTQGLKTTDAKRAVDHSETISQKTSAIEETK